MGEQKRGTVGIDQIGGRGAELEVGESGGGVERGKQLGGGGDLEGGMGQAQVRVVEEEEHGVRGRAQEGVIEERDSVVPVT